jgi:hypothetical protein
VLCVSELPAAVAALHDEINLPTYCSLIFRFSSPLPRYLRVIHAFLSKAAKTWAVVSSISFSSAPASVAVFLSAYVLSLCLFSGFYSLVCYLSSFGSKFLVRMSPYTLTPYPKWLGN